MVKKRILLLLASMVWMIAGFNVIRIGIIAYKHYFSLTNFLLSLIVFCFFWFLIFHKLVTKHKIRIHSYISNKQYFWNFFDLKSFLIMAFMITFGILIRKYNLAPEIFIAIFYTGLGSALMLAGIEFGYHFITY